ncbi:MAG: type I methionyl aminopeptidase [Tenericutes bacterium]|nr:type I methionyl aminopeptidase [Mycoplasmatota bacterium]
MITIKDKREIELMKHAGLLVSKMHKFIKPYIKEGITTKELDKLCYDFIKKNDAVPSCLGYEGYPATLCTSVNDTVVHGIPGNEKLKNGDIISIDVVIGYKGYQGDAAWTYSVGEIDDEKKYLLEHTKEALYEGIKMVKPGNRIGDISNAVELCANKYNLGIVKELCGHGIGLDMHEDPDIPNYGEKGKGPRLKEGMVICIEPMLNSGSADIYMKDDNWTIKTIDKRPSAHFEHTILVTKDGYEILTPRLDEED